MLLIILTDDRTKLEMEQIEHHADIDVCPSFSSLASFLTFPLSPTFRCSSGTYDMNLILKVE